MKYENKLLNYYTNVYQYEFFYGENDNYTLMMLLEDVIFLGTKCRHYRERIGRLKKQVQKLNCMVELLKFKNKAENKNVNTLLEELKDDDRE